MLNLCFAIALSGGPTQASPPAEVRVNQRPTGIMVSAGTVKLTKRQLDFVAAYEINSPPAPESLGLKVLFELDNAYLVRSNDSIPGALFTGEFLLKELLKVGKVRESVFLVETSKLSKAAQGELGSLILHLHEIVDVIPKKMAFALGADVILVDDRGKTRARTLFRARPLDEDIFREYGVQDDFRPGSKQSEKTPTNLAHSVSNLTWQDLTSKGMQTTFTTAEKLLKAYEPIRKKEVRDNIQKLMELAFPAEIKTVNDLREQIGTEFERLPKEFKEWFLDDVLTYPNENAEADENEKARFFKEAKLKDVRYSLGFLKFSQQGTSFRGGSRILPILWD